MIHDLIVSCSFPFAAIIIVALICATVTYGIHTEDRRLSRRG